jgi:hypothetical protein
MDESLFAPSAVPFNSIHVADSGSARSETGYDLSSAALRIDIIEQRRDRRATARSDGAVYFTVDRDVEYVLSGDYALTGSRELRLLVELVNLITGEVLFFNEQISGLTVDEAFVVGGQGGDESNSLSGSLFGMLPAGGYLLRYIALISSTEANDSPASATGQVQLFFVPAECNDGIDNDGDGLVDAALDPGCVDNDDNSEQAAHLPCDDGLDNDGDGLIDTLDSDCSSPTDPVEGLDLDADDIEDTADNCPGVFNPFQVDTDGNGIGDLCNEHEDFDRDEFADVLDNCSLTANTLQLDTVVDGFGDACDCDFTQDGTCTIGDFNVFLGFFIQGSDSTFGTDMDGDGSVGIQDFNLFLSGFQSGKPGPSGLREECGLTICGAGLECCNPVAGICVVPGQVCVQ